MSLGNHVRMLQRHEIPYHTILLLIARCNSSLVPYPLAHAMGDETAPLLPASYSAFRRPNEVSLSRVILLFFLVVLPMFFLSELELPSFEVPWSHEDYGELCPQVGALHPQVHRELAQNVSALCDSQNFVETTAGWLGGAVRIA